jgi:hypothetical protein
LGVAPVVEAHGRAPLQQGPVSLRARPASLGAGSPPRLTGGVDRHCSPEHLSSPPNAGQKVVATIVKSRFGKGHYTKDNDLESKTLYDIVFDAVGKRKSSRFKLHCKRSLAAHGKYISVDDGSPIPMENLILLKNLAEANLIRPVIDRCYPLEDMVEAHGYVDTGHKKGNVVITVAHDSSA